MVLITGIIHIASYDLERKWPYFDLDVSLAHLSGGAPKALFYSPGLPKFGPGQPIL